MKPALQSAWRGRGKCPTRRGAQGLTAHRHFPTCPARPGMAPKALSPFPSKQIQGKDAHSLLPGEVTLDHVPA